MKHLTLKAAVTEATDTGSFTAVISAVTEDRDGDVVEPSALVNAMEKWLPLGKKIPLQWDHETDAEFIIGHIDPGTVHEEKGEVIASGFVDQETDRGKHAWRLVKSGVIGFSYGFLILEAEPRAKGGLHIKAIDVFEITMTPAPANSDTRVLAYKSLADLKAAVAEIEREEEEEHLPEIEPGAIVVEVDPEPIAETPPAPAAADLAVEADRLEREEQRRQELAVIHEAEAGAVDLPPEPPADPPAKAVARPAEELDAQVQRIEQDERLRKEREAIESATAEHEKALRDLGVELKRQTDFANSVKAQVDEAREALVALELFDPIEVAGVKGGILRSAWTATYVKALPDTAFLHVDGTGRHFPIRDAAGTVDMEHVKNALARLPESGLSDTVKAQLTQRAERILANQAEVDATGKEKGAVERGSRPVDPLRKQADDLALELASDGLSLRAVKTVEQPQGPAPQMDVATLRQRMFEETLTLLQ